jgi:hypothetical protein
MQRRGPRNRAVRPPPPPLVLLPAKQGCAGARSARDGPEPAGAWWQAGGRARRELGGWGISGRLLPDLVGLSALQRLCGPPPLAAHRS